MSNELQVATEIREGFNAFKANHNKELARNREEILALSDRMLETEQKLVPGLSSGAFGGFGASSFAATLLGNPDVQGFRERRLKDVGIPVTAKELLRIQANTITQDGDNISQNYRTPGIVAAPLRKRFLREILTVLPCTGSAVEFTRELAYTNNAAVQYDASSPATTEGALKAQSSITFELVNAPIPTVAHWLKSSRQALSDQPALQNFLDQRLRLGLEIKLDDQILNGTGSSGNMTGLTVSATAFTPTSGDTALDSISRAAATLLDAGYMPDGIVMSATNFGAIERLKDVDGNFILGDPSSSTGPALWGIPVFRSASMTSGKFLIGDFASSTALFMREDAIVQMTESNDTDFTKNLVTIRAELRAVIAALVPAGMRYGNLTL